MTNGIRPLEVDDSDRFEHGDEHLDDCAGPEDCECADHIDEANEQAEADYHDHPRGE